MKLHSTLRSTPATNYDAVLPTERTVLSAQPERRAQLIRDAAQWCARHGMLSPATPDFSWLCRLVGVDERDVLLGERLAAVGGERTPDDADYP